MVRQGSACLHHCPTPSLPVLFPMHEISFEDAVQVICERDKRLDRDAYYFLREALDATVKTLRSDETPEHQHVNGGELLDGLRDHALEKFGPMAATVLESWGVRSTDDIGRMVFQLIEIGAFGQSEEDRPEDFANRYSFDEAFRAPFRPKGTRRRRKRRPISSADAQHDTDTDAGRKTPAQGQDSSSSSTSTQDEPELL